MDLAESDEQRFLREAVRGVVAREAPLGTVRRWVLEDEHDDRPFALAVRQGWPGIGVDEDAGGQGGGTFELAILAEELGRGAVPADRLYASLLTALLLSRSDEAAARELVAALADGSLAGAIVRSASHPLDARSDGSLVLGGADADVFVTWTDAELRAVDRAEASVRPARMVDRTRSLATVEVGDGGRRVGSIAPDSSQWLAATAAILVAADALGAAQRMLDLTVEYVRQRVQFGVPVGSFQAVKHAAAEMLAAIEGTRGVVQYAAWAVGVRADGSALDAWVAKARAARTALHVADRALFLHGAVGYTWEHDLQLLFKRAKSDALLFGDAAEYDERIADALELVGRPTSLGRAPSR